MLLDSERLVNKLRQEPWAKVVAVDSDFWPLLFKWFDEHVLSDFFERAIGQVNEIVDIDPELSEPQILERATRYMVDFLGARSASVRIYDPQSEQMLSYGSYPSEEENRETFIPLEGSIAGEVVKSRVPFLAPDLSQEKRYQDKKAIDRRGVCSLMAIPFEIPRFFPHERGTVGVIQIYYAEKGRGFDTIEVSMADLMARRLSFVISRKKILSLQKMSEKKDAIVRHIFLKLGSRGGVKMSQVFNRVVPELADMVDLQSCALFSVTKSLDKLVLEAGFSESDGYHSVGMVFDVRSEPVFELLLSMRSYSGDSVYEIVTPSYILVVDPQKSDLISENLKQFAGLNDINSILYIPLTVEGEVTHLMTFDALGQRQRYRDDEIDIFLFLGRELMKARRLELLDDALHDFKNPAIATVGFARRLKELIVKGGLEGSREQIKKYADILVEETSRLQELAMGIYQVGEEQVIDLTSVLRMRLEINREAIKEQLRQDIDIQEGPYDHDLKVRCYALHVERIFDNLLNNATKAIPLKGGVLSVRTFKDGDWACASIRNTGQISEQDRLKILEGEGEGRGLYIIHRIMRLLKGKIDILGGEGATTFIVSLPLYRA